MNSDSKPFTLSYVRFYFTMEALDDSVLPPYLGSTCRGRWGIPCVSWFAYFPGHTRMGTD